MLIWYQQAENRAAGHVTVGIFAFSVAKCLIATEGEKVDHDCSSLIYNELV